MSNLSDAKFKSDFMRYMHERKHIMLMYDNMIDYRYAASMFIADGLTSNDCCIMATDEYNQDLIKKDLRALGVAVDNCINDAKLIIIDVKKHYSNEKKFDPEKTMLGWQRFTTESVSKGFNSVRAVGEATFGLEGEGAEKNLIYYENIINESLFPDYPFMSLCVYNKKIYPDDVLKAAIQAHPMLIFGRKIFKNNIYYVPPNIYFNSNTASSEIDLWLNNVESSNDLVQQIVKSEEELRQALEATNDGIWEYNLATGAFKCSDRWAKMLGYEKNEISNFGCFCDNNIFPEDKPLFENSFNRYLSGENDKYEAEIRLKTKNGSYKWIYTRGKIVERDSTGKPLRVVGAHTDITNNKNAETALAQNEQLFRMLFDDAPLPYQSLDINGNFVTVNKVFCETLGYKPEELIGKNFSEILHPDWVDHFRENFPRFKAIGEVLGVEFEIKKKDGDFIFVSFTGKIGKEPDGSFRQTHCVFRDVSAEKSYQRSLIKAKEEAEQASYAKSIFLANMSHELRTPLNGIVGMQELLKTTKLNQEQEYFVELANQSAKRLTTLLGDILDITKIETGKVDVCEKIINFRELIDSLQQLFFPVCEQKGIQFETYVDDSIPESFLGDSVRLLQILNNILGNAVKYTEEGEISCKADLLSNTSYDSHRILFTISDTGIGLPEEKLEDLFQPFVQADEGYTRSYQGAGLGLAIVKQLVDLLGGNISVSSELGVGTTFHCSLPFNINFESQSEEIKPEYSVFCTAPCPYSILLAEDERVNRIAIKSILEKAGFEVSTVNNGELAIEKIKSQKYDLVLMDIQMPILDGIEATKAIRSGSAGIKYKKIPIIALTAYAMDGDKETFLQAGMDAYLSKPLNYKKMLVTINEILNKD